MHDQLLDAPIFYNLSLLSSICKLQRNRNCDAKAREIPFFLPFMVDFRIESILPYQKVRIQYRIMSTADNGAVIDYRLMI